MGNGEYNEKILAHLLLWKDVMKGGERVLPRILALLLLLGSTAMAIPLAATVTALFRGYDVAIGAWVFPLLVLGIGALLTSLLTRMQVPLRLYAVAVTLWIVTAGYVVMRVL